MSAMPAWAMISVVSGWRSTSARRPAAIGGRPRPPWIRIGTFHSDASSNTGPSRSSVDWKPCARGWSLIPARAGLETASRLVERRLVQVEAHERDQTSFRTRRERQRSVVRGAERRVAVGLVEAEHERARDAVAAHHLGELVVVADHAVDVVPQMEVRVEDLGAGRQLAHELLVVGRAELERACERIRHLAKLPCRLESVTVSDVLIYGDTVRSPELRHEIPVAVPDPFLYAEAGGVRHMVGQLDRSASVA